MKPLKEESSKPLKNPKFNKPNFETPGQKPSKGNLKTQRDSQREVQKESQREVPKVVHSFKTLLGQQVLENKYSSIHEVLEDNKILEPKIVDLFNQHLSSKVVSIDRICHTLKSGKVYLFRVVVLVGNGNGLIGLGVAKSIAKITAVRKAELCAKKNLVSLKKISSEGNCYKPRKVTSQKYGATTVTVTPLLSNTITASKNGKIYAQLSGLTNLRAYVGTKKRLRKGKVGSALNYFKCLHECIRKQTL